MFAWDIEKNLSKRLRGWLKSQPLQIVLRQKGSQKTVVFWDIEKKLSGIDIMRVWKTHALS